MYQISALIFLTVLTWAIAIWATYESSTTDDAGERQTKIVDEQDRRERKAA